MSYLFPVKKLLMDLVPTEIEAYAQAHTEAESDLLRFINRETHAKFLRPRMLSGPLQGRLLALFSRMIQPNRILEIGTYTGYSALCLCEGLTPEGRLITIEANEELEEFARSNFAKSPFLSQIDFRIGNALDILPTLPEGFDLVFIDADKINYQKYYDLIIDKIKPGGILMADNVLWSGKVVEQTQTKTDRETLALQNFNRKLSEDHRVECVLLPIRDGIMVAQKR